MDRFFKKIITMTGVLVGISVPFIVFAVSLPDPLGAESPVEVIARIVQGVLGLVGIFAFLNFVIAGFGLITSHGNPDRVQKHKENLKWTIVGIALLFGAYAIVAYVIDRLTAATG